MEENNNVFLQKQIISKEEFSKHYEAAKGIGIITGYNNIEVIENGKVSNKYSRPPFGITDLNLPAQNQMAERRFKQMFNDLPKYIISSRKNNIFKTKNPPLRWI